MGPSEDDTKEPLSTKGEGQGNFPESHSGASYASVMLLSRKQGVSGSEVFGATAVT